MMGTIVAQFTVRLYGQLTPGIRHLLQAKTYSGEP